MKFLKNKPFQIIFAVFCGFFLSPFLNEFLISFFFSISGFLKEFLMWVLPFLIFFCLSSVLSGFNKSAPLLVFLTLFLVILSNGLPLIIGYGVGSIVLPSMCGSQMLDVSTVQSNIKPLFYFPIPSIIKNEWALLGGFLSGILVSFFKNEKKKYFLNIFGKGKEISLYFLQKGFIPFLPLYVFGFMTKMDHDGMLAILFTSYSKVFLLTIGLILIYIFIFYFLVAGLNISKTIFYLKNMIPAGLTGFSTMSSMASLPVTLDAVEKNTNDKTFSQFIVPATVNIHMAGDGLNISLTALSLLIMTSQPIPSFTIFLLFTLHYCLAKFSAVGAPGGGVIVVLPVLQEFLGLSPEMAGLLATIYILQDSLMTASNVMLNGIFNVSCYKLFKRFGIYK